MIQSSAARSAKTQYSSTIFLFLHRSEEMRDQRSRPTRNFAITKGINFRRCSAAREVSLRRFIALLRSRPTDSAANFGMKLLGRAVAPRRTRNKRRKTNVAGNRPASRPFRERGPRDPRRDPARLTRPRDKRTADALFSINFAGFVERTFNYRWPITRLKFPATMTP